MSQAVRFASLEPFPPRARRRPASTLAALALGGAVLLAGQTWSGLALAQSGADEPAMPSFTPNDGTPPDTAQPADEAETSDASDADATATATESSDPADETGYTPHTWGDPDAPVEMLEFSSYTCGHCAAFHADTLPTLKEQYIDTGKVHLVLIDFPLDNVAAAVSMVTHCAPPATGKKLVDIFFADQDAWMTRTPVESISGMVRLAGMSGDDVEACLANDALYESLMAEREAAAQTWGITGTPTFVIAGERHTGSYRLDEMTAALDAALARVEADSGSDSDAPATDPPSAD
jgi:protein-disulfide isomerase